MNAPDRRGAKSIFFLFPEVHKNVLFIILSVTSFALFLFVVWGFIIEINSNKTWTNIAYLATVFVFPFIIGLWVNHFYDLLKEEEKNLSMENVYNDFSNKINELSSNLDGRFTFYAERIENSTRDSVTKMGSQNKLLFIPDEDIRDIEKDMMGAKEGIIIIASSGKSVVDTVLKIDKRIKVEIIICDPLSILEFDHVVQGFALRNNEDIIEKAQKAFSTLKRLYNNRENTEIRLYKGVIPCAFIVIDRSYARIHPYLPDKPNRLMFDSRNISTSKRLEDLLNVIDYYKRSSVIVNESVFNIIKTRLTFHSEKNNKL